MGLRDSVAVVVGAARGLGRAIASAFAAEGCRVGLWDVSPDVQSAADSLPVAESNPSPGSLRSPPSPRWGEGNHASWIVDVASDAAVRSAANGTWAKFGSVDH